MALIHGSKEVFKLAATDLSSFIDSVDFKSTADSHDVTTLGALAHAFKGGLSNGTFSIKGFYDNGAAATPKIIIQPALGTVIAFSHAPEGSGTGNPATTGSVLVIAYGESSPAADMCAWTAELQITGVITTADL